MNPAEYNKIIEAIKDTYPEHAVTLHDLVNKDAGLLTEHERVLNETRASLDALRDVNAKLAARVIAPEPTIDETEPEPLNLDSYVSKLQSAIHEGKYKLGRPIE